MSAIEVIVAVEVTRDQSIGTLIRCAVAFGAHSLMIVGSDRIGTHGAHGSQRHLPIRHVFEWETCLQYIRSLGSYEVCGISLCGPDKELCASSSSASSDISYSLKSEDIRIGDELPEIKNLGLVSIDDKKFNRSCMFVVPPSSGLSHKQLQICDSVVFVPVINKAFEKYIKVETKLAICLYKFTKQFPDCYREKHYTGEKYDVQTLDKNVRFMVTSLETRKSVQNRDEGLLIEEDGEDIIALFS